MLERLVSRAPLLSLMAAWAVGGHVFAQQATQERVGSIHELVGVAKPAPKAARTKTFMKGWRLHVWQQGEETYYSLMPGTNWLPPEADVVKSAVKGLDSIKAQLDELQEGQDVFLCGKSFDSRPPKDKVTAVTEYCKKIGLRVQ
jgi:hypothetical protein